MAKLIPPSPSFKQSYIEALGEETTEPLPRLLTLLQQEHGPDRPTFLLWLQHHFAEFIDLISSHQAIQTRYPQLPQQFHYWFVNKNVFIGRTIIRPNLTESLRRQGGNIGLWIRPSLRRHGFGTTLLHLSLVTARQHGLSTTLLTCQTTNTPSIHLIKKFHPQQAKPSRWTTPNRLRYWVKTNQT